MSSNSPPVQQAKRPKSAMSRINSLSSFNTKVGSNHQRHFSGPGEGQPPEPRNPESSPQQQRLKDSTWFQKHLIGRTPSLPSSLGKKKQSFFKKLQCRKISAPSFSATLRPLRLQQEANKACSPSATPPLPQHATPPLSHHATPIRNNPYNRLDFDPELYCSSSEPCGGGYSSGCSVINCSPFPKVTSLEEAQVTIGDLRGKFRSQSHQIISYRKKLRQQKIEIRELEEANRLQLEEISSQLLLFESNLRNKERQIQETLGMKDQVILKQQYVIKKLLRKCYGNDFIPPSPHNGSSANTNNNNSGNNSKRHPSLARHNSESSSKDTNTNGSEDYDNLNDSDSAIMLEDHLTEVSLLVPTITGGHGGAKTYESGDIKISRSISDVVGKAKDVNTNTNVSSGSGFASAKGNSSRKTKEERRISNRQKLLTIAKRHSGFLKRPDILETVYSVEEDGEQQQQQQGGGTKEDGKAPEATKQLEMKPPAQVSSLQRENNCVLTGFRYRIDSDITTASDLDYSTDDDSTRLFSTEGSLTTSCSQPCSRRSSYGGPCSLPCSRRSSYGHTPIASRRSSYGSHANLTINTSDENESELKVQTTFNRVMCSNHRTVTKPKDVKFKRINKSKSRSLEELRGKLKWQITPNIIIQDEDHLDEGQKHCTSLDQANNQSEV